MGGGLDFVQKQQAPARQEPVGHSADEVQEGGRVVAGPAGIRRTPRRGQDAAPG